MDCLIASLFIQVFLSLVKKNDKALIDYYATSSYVLGSLMHLLLLYLFIISLAGVSEDELFGQFFGALEKIHYFKPTSDGHDDQIQLDRATRLFQNAVMV